MRATSYSVLVSMVLFATPVMAYEVGQVANGGAVSGLVMFNGEVPVRKIIPNKDVSTCGEARTDALIEVGPGNGVANTLVYLADVSKGKPWPAEGSKPELNNKNCRFEPAMQVIQGGEVVVVNKDPVLHNTHGYYGRRTAFNTALPNQDQKVTVELLKTGTVKVDCDAHGWMEGWVFVRDNPYFAVTGADGKFTIADVPPGNYMLVTLQPYAAMIEQPVTVTGGKATDLKIDLNVHS